MNIDLEDFNGGFTELKKIQQQKECPPEHRPVNNSLPPPEIDISKMVEEIKKSFKSENEVKMKLLAMIIAMILISVIFYEPFFFSNLQKMGLTTAIIIISIIVFSVT